MLSRVGFVAFFIVLSTSIARATVTIDSISGVSSFTTASASGSTTTPFTIYGGMAGSACSPDSTTQKCSTCTSFRSKCNPNAVQMSSIITVKFTYTAGANLTTAIAKGATNPITTNRAVLTSTTTGEVEFTWTNLCAAIGTNCNGTIQIGVGKDSTTLDDKVEIKVIQAGDSGLNDTHVICPPGAGASVAGDGLCFVKFQPGDGKVYLTQVAAPSNFPATGGGVVQYTSVIFYYESQIAGETDQQTYDRIGLTSKVSASVPTTTGGVAEDRVKDLGNDQRYCFVMASVDAAGNISAFTPTSSATNFDVTNYCATPEPVVGLLDDKRCFIATAAWGSSMDEHVDDFRRFRDRFLLTFEGGRKLVRAYYEWSPPWAKWIAQSEALRAIVRALLWPVLGFARLSLAWGLIPSLLVIVGGFGALASVAIRRRRRIA